MSPVSRESLLIGDSAKQLDIKTPYQRGVLNTQSVCLKVHSDISRDTHQPDWLVTQTSVGLQTANYLVFFFCEKQRGGFIKQSELVQPEGKIMGERDI